ncbi:MAG: phage terminase large subunit [Synergistaceae bacterium]|nr:phage terminase large subunit [Synergistaceae bacterium]
MATTNDAMDAMIGQSERALNSLVAFREAFMPAPDDVRPARFHEEWSEILLRGKGHFAIEAFRESAKTQIVIRANLLHALTFPQPGREYLVIICATQRTASKKLSEVSREFQANPELRGLIAKVREDSGLALEVGYRTGETVRIEAYGKGAAVRGLSWGAKRPDLVIIDDPQDAEDARSETVTDTDWDWFLSDVLFLGRDTRIFLIGNNLGERCVIERVINAASDFGFTARRIPILDEKGDSAWPEKWPAEKIRAERDVFARQGKTDIWFREKMCRAVSPESQKFKREYFRYYDTVNTSGMSVYTTVDLAVSQKPHADYSAIVTVGVNSENHWFVLDVEYGRYDPSTTMDAVFSAYEKWRPLTVGIETVAYQAALKHFLEREMPKRNLFFRITELRAERKKELRIDAMQPRFAVGSVWFRRGAAWLDKLEGELLAYPHGAHDDVIDALAYMEQIAAVPGNGKGGDWSRLQTGGWRV